MKTLLLTLNNIIVYNSCSMVSSCSDAFSALWILWYRCRVRTEPCLCLAVLTGTKVPLGERCVRERGVSGRRLWTTRDSHQRGRHAGVPALSLPYWGTLTSPRTPSQVLSLRWEAGSLLQDLSMFTEGKGSEVVFGVADYWVSRVTWQPEDQTYHLLGKDPSWKAILSAWRVVVTKIFFFRSNQISLVAFSQGRTSECTSRVYVNTNNSTSVLTQVKILFILIQLM